MKGKAKNVSAGVAPQNKKKVGPVDPKGAYTKVQERTIGKMKMGGKMAKSGASFPDLNKDGKVTKADILKGRGVIAKNGAAMKKQAAIAIAMKKEGKTPKKKMQYGGEAASMAPIMKTGGTVKKAMMGAAMAPAAPMMKKGGSMKKCKHGCK